LRSTSSANTVLVTDSHGFYRDATLNVTVEPGIPTTPPTLSLTCDGSNVTASWPATYVGWRLQSQTNPLTVGLSTNWQMVPGSTTTHSVTQPVNPASPTVFFRLVYP
jgi:hypothetical protein